MNACCTGWSAPSAARPSIVVMCPPATAPTVVVQERRGWPSTSTVQAPQSPSPQPYFVPVSPASNRMKLSRLRWGSSQVRGASLMVRVIIVRNHDNGAQEYGHRASDPGVRSEWAMLTVGAGGGG